MRDTTMPEEPKWIERGIERIVWVVEPRGDGFDKNPLDYLELQGLTDRPRQLLDGIVNVQHNGAYHGIASHENVVFNAWERTRPNGTKYHHVQITGIQTKDIEYIDFAFGQLDQLYQARKRVSYFKPL